MDRFIKGKLSRYDFYKGCSTADNPIKLTRDGKTCDALLFKGLGGPEDFMRLGEHRLLTGRALSEYEIMNGEGA